MSSQKSLLLTAAMAVISVSAMSCGATSSRTSNDPSSRGKVPRRAAVDEGEALFKGQAVLGSADLVQAAVARNPSIEVARQGWRASLARQPQVMSFEDPMVSYSMAPLSIASSRVDYGQVIEVSQALPYPGKRALRGQVARAEAEGAHQDYRATRLHVARMAASLYYELYGVDRSIDIYAEFERELREHRETLTAHLAAGHAWQDDALKVDIDLGEVVQVQIDLAAERDLLITQINELLHRRPSLPLPPLPDALPTPAEVDRSSDDLQEVALRERPEMQAAGARQDRDASEVALAKRSFYPDFRVMGQYNSMFPAIEHEIMVGVSMNIPVWRANRKGAVREAEARSGRALANADVAEDQIRSEVDRAYRAHTAAASVLRSYQSDIVPPAIARVEAVRASLDTGRTSFIEVLRSDHELLAIRLRYEKALANAHWRLVDLQIATGVLPSSSDDGGAR